MATEETVWTGSPSQWINTVPFLLCGLASLTGVLAIIAIPYAIWRWLVVKNTKYELTTQRLKTSTGVLNKTTEELELYRVKDSKFDQPLWLRFFALGNVVLVSSDATTPTTSVTAVLDAEALRERIRALVEERRERKLVRIAEIE